MSDQIHHIHSQRLDFICKCLTTTPSFSDSRSSGRLLELAEPSRCHQQFANNWGACLGSFNGFDESLTAVLSVLPMGLGR
jgi:hypothetical protein